MNSDVFSTDSEFIGYYIETVDTADLADISNQLSLISYHQDIILTVILSLFILLVCGCICYMLYRFMLKFIL